MMTARPTLTDVARQAGVHTSTASRALADHPSIPEDTRERVKAVALSLGYHVDPFTAVLMKSRRRGRPLPHHANLGFIVAESRKDAWRATAWIHEVYIGAKEFAAAAGYSLEVFWAGEDEARGEAFDRILRTRGMQGLILSPEHEAPLKFNLSWQDFAVLSLHYGSSAFIPRFHQLVSNHFHSILQVCRRCSDLGYTRIGLLLRDHPEIHLEYGRLVFGAYHAVTDAHGASRRVPPLVVRELDPARIAHWVRDNRIDAVIQAGGGYSPMFGPQDLCAALREHGFQVGPELGLVVMAHRPSPELAVVDERTSTIGATAARLLIEMLQQHQRGVPEDPIVYQLDGRFHDGSSLPGRLPRAPSDRSPSTHAHRLPARSLALDHPLKPCPALAR
jgi:DNA-binding LacI/PurR family transcriptional regulator